MSNELENTHTDELLAKFLSAEVTAAEKTEALAWINASQENSRYFEGLKEIWNNAAPAAVPEVDTTAAWNKLKTRMNVNEPPAKTSRFSFPRLAAGIALFIVAGSLAYFISQNNKAPEMKTLAGTPTGDINAGTLPDGSKVAVNRNSQLTFPESFTGKTREVELKGEAFFDVSHDATHPFIIHTGELDIKVVGTSFDVNAFPGTDSVRVSVRTGKVKCYTGKDSVMLLPGEIAVYRKSTGVLRKGVEDDPNTSSYRDRIFKFHKTRLTDAVRLLNNAYGSNIIIKSEAIRDCRIDGTYSNDTLDNILQTIEDALGVSVKKSEGKIFLDGKGCPH